MKTVTYNLSTSSITNVLRVLRKEQRDLTKKMDLLCKRLAEIGADTAQIEFAWSEYEGPNDDVNVVVEQTENGYKIVASGEAVAFIEFGAGATYGHGYPVNETKVPPNIPVPGSWSTDPIVGKGHWNDPNGWYYAHGERTLGNPPAMAMWYASEVMRRNIEQIAREVFGK